MVHIHKEQDKVSKLRSSIITILKVHSVQKGFLTDEKCISNPSTITSAHQLTEAAHEQVASFFLIRLKAPLIHVFSSYPEVQSCRRQTPSFIHDLRQSQAYNFAGENNTSIRWCRLLIIGLKNGKLFVPVGPAYLQMGSQVNLSTTTYHAEAARGRALLVRQEAV